MSWEALARSSLISYCCASDPGYNPAPHHMLLAAYLEAAYRGDITRLMIFMPPQHGKSELASRKFVEWAMGKSGGAKKIGFATYAQDYANFWGRQIRDTIDASPVFAKIFPECVVDQGSHAKHRFDLTNRGWYMATSVGGPLTGRGPHIILIDDPVKNYEEARSEAIQQRNIDWYKTTVKTRLPKCIIIIQTRWHENDLSGWLLSQQKSGEGDKWTIINLEAISESPDDPLGRPVATSDPSTWRDEHCLWPQKANAVELAGIRRAVGTQTWTSMFQQRPTALEGGIFKRQWWKYLPAGANLKTVAKAAEHVCHSWDLSFKETDSGSYVVGLLMAKRGADFFVLDCIRDRMDFPSTKKAIRALQAKWPMADAKYVENKANGPAIIDDLKDEIPGMIGVEKDISKDAAWHAASPYVESGNVYLPDPTDAPWVSDFVEELAGLPNSKYNDQGDAFAQGIYKLKDLGTRAIIDVYRQMAEEIKKGRAA